MGKKKSIILAALVLIAAGAAVYYFFLTPPSTEEAVGVTPQKSPGTEDFTVEEEIEPIEVDLDKSDDLVRKLVEELSSNPGLARWLVSENLIRTFVSIVDVIANGGSPRRLIDSIQIEGDFQVSQTEGRLFINPRSYRRYDRIADIIASLDTDGCVKLYKQLRLPIRQAYRELGYPEGDFNVTLKRAIQALLETPIVEDRIYLGKDVITYTIADPKLERLSPAQKHLLRMGPDNMRAIQAKLQEIAQAMGFLNGRSGSLSEY
jgi:hypothetical protein